MFFLIFSQATEKCRNVVLNLLQNRFDAAVVVDIDKLAKVVAFSCGKKSTMEFPIKIMAGLQRTPARDLVME